MDAVLQQLRKEGYPVPDEDVARLAPTIPKQIDMIRRYSCAVPESVARGELQPLRSSSRQRPLNRKFLSQFPLNPVPAWGCDSRDRQQGQAPLLRDWHLLYQGGRKTTIIFLDYCR
jgi:hypothetical protein